MFRLTAIYPLLFSCLFAFSQDLENFSRLESNGKIPSLFIEFLQEQIDAEKQDLKTNQKISRKRADEFSSITNYRLQQLVRSGRVLYGDPLTAYANKIVEKLDEYAEEDLSSIEVYTLKSNEVNAFATHQGLIFVTVGLWGQLANEAQLAYVLAHEITHITEKHNLLTYQNTKDLFTKGRFGSGTISEYYRYSKENEEESDEAGFKLAAKAGYDAEAIYNTFNVLLYSYLPVDEVVFDYSFVENEYFKIAESLKLDEVEGIDAEEDVDDEFHTHPNIRSRRYNVRDLLSRYDGGEIYLLEDEATFKKFRNLARFEMVNIFMRDGDYINGLYHNYVLQQQYANNLFLKETEAMMWYGHTALVEKDQTEYTTNYRKKQGEIQQLYYFLYKLQNKDLAALATKQIWEASLQNPKSEILLELRKRVMRNFVSYEDNKLGSFASEIKQVEVETDTSEKELSKYDKIKKKQSKGDQSRPTYNALIGLVTNEDFKAAYFKAEEFLEEKDKATEETTARRKPQHSTLDIDNLMMIAPIYNLNDKRKSTSKNISKNDVTSSTLTEMVEKNADKLGMNINFVNNFTAEDFNTEKYNQFSVIFDYLAERSNYRGEDFYPYNAKHIAAVTETYGSKYLGLVGIYTEVERRPFNGSAFLLSALFYPTFPLYLKWQLTSDKSTDYGFFVFNLETHNPTFSSTKFFEANMNTHLQNAHIYHSLNQITKK
jgi:hypothetical protein